MISDLEGKIEEINWYIKVSEFAIKNSINEKDKRRHENYLKNFNETVELIKSAINKRIQK